MSRVEFIPHQPAAGDNSYDVVKAQESVTAFLQELYDESPMLDGVLMEDIALTGGATTSVEHGLGRAYRGFVRVRSTIAGDYPSDVTSDDKANFLKLDVSNTQTVTLWVF